MVAEVKSVSELLSTITDAFTAARDAFTEGIQALNPPEDGMSLLDVKNDLLLSYLQHLVFLVLLRLKSAVDPQTANVDLGKEVIKKLIELRAYLDRGVRPLEGRLRYQIDKVLRAAEDADRSAPQKAQPNGLIKKSKKVKKPKTTTTDDSDVSFSGSDSDGSEAFAGQEDSDEEAANARPNPQALQSAARAQAAAQATNKTGRGASTRDGMYKPPRIAPTVMPSDRTSRTSIVESEETRTARRRKNALLDEYVTEEHSSAPTTQPSIGSNNTILDRGRQHTSLNSRDRNKERERREHEERNFVRLPGASKVERKKDKARQVREGRDMYGGEDWTGLGGLGDRVSRTVSGGGKERGSLLERREKRKRDTIDMPRGDGVGIGETFDKRRKVVQGRQDRKRGRR